MRTIHHAKPAASVFARALAGLFAGLVLVLSLLAVAPDLHKRLHDGNHGHAHTAGVHDDDGCVVQLFAHGVTTPLALLAVALPSANWTDAPAIIRRLLHLSAPRYLHRPECGPPFVG